MGPLKNPLITGATQVGLGAAIGTLLRATLENSFPAAPGAWPLTIFLINLAGSLILGFLLTVLANAGSDTGWRHAARLTLGTGVIGGFTTYSTFIVEIHGLAAPLALAYAGTSLIAGIACAAAGIALANTCLPPHAAKGAQ